MDFISKFRRQLAIRSFLLIILPILIMAGVWFACDNFLSFEPLFTLIVSLSVGLAGAIIASNILTIMASRPLEKIEEAVMYAAHSERGGVAPTIDSRLLARELVESMSRQIYNLGSSSPVQAQTANTSTIQTSAPAPNPEVTQIIIDAIPMPIIGMNSQQVVTIANKKAAEYIGKPAGELIGKPIYDNYKFSFQSDQGLEEWLKSAQESSVTSVKSWDRVRHLIDQDNWKQFDLLANFSSGSSSGTETMLAIFDRSEQYNLDDQEISYVALAVHELRTPLTIMRGYIEVFEDELGKDLSPELRDFMFKMQASAQQLAAFVSNILNVARIEEDQLALKLRSEDIGDILKVAISDLELRAQVHGKHIELTVDPNLPKVAADRISVHEVINNLVDNAIKYSDKSEKIIVTSKINSDGLVETSVQDFGLGIPASVMGELFQKFHRSHKSRVQVGGTGLGLYLCKALVKAHGGNIWVRSKEGEGSIFSFTLLPYDQLSGEQTSDEDGIIRGAHGWIKNHSLYRN